MKVADWFEAAERDMRAARVLIERLLFQPGLFHCQQAIEKALKALCLVRAGRYPPRHELSTLAKQAGALAALTPEQLDLLSELEALYITARYPEEDTYRAINDEGLARGILSRTEVFLEWLRQQLKS